MKNIKYNRKCSFFGFMLVMFWLPYNIQAQNIIRQTVSCYGSNGKVDGISVSQTVGQSYNTDSDAAKGKYNAGFQQPVIFSIEDIQSDVKELLEMDLYPNPAVYTLNLSMHSPMDKALIQVFNLKGELVQAHNLTSFSTYQIDCSNWSNGTYFIVVKDPYLNSKTYKLIISK